MFNPRNLVTIVTVLVAGYTVNRVVGYNLSPKSNQVFHDPKLTTGMPKVQSSHFGASLSLRPSGIIVGAPRAQSTIESQRKINETGAIYKCSFTGGCTPFIFDDKGNINDENIEYYYKSEKKDNQWLGATMDGGPNDNDKLVVCAPRLIAPTQVDYLMHGICYWTNDTSGDRPKNVNTIAPLRGRKEQARQYKGQRYFYFIYAEAGISVHVTKDNEGILMGAPGIHTWKGTVLRHQLEEEHKDIGLSRRDLGGESIKQKKNDVYAVDVPNPQLWEQANDSYFGYSVSSGYFDSTQPSKVGYVATAPQANEQSGEAYIFDYITTLDGDSAIKILYTFHGTYFGEYFGYAVLGEDVNGDGLSDVIITAPQYSSGVHPEQGAFYVFINKGRYTFQLQKKIVSPIEGTGRFGTSISSLGDINHDGYNDIAVGAPFAGEGAVFIYLGSQNGLRELPSQKLTGDFVGANKWGAQMFGHGLSKGSDVDNNGFNDFAIGAPNAESVFFYRAYPVVKIIATINSQSRELQPTDSRFQIDVCYAISTTSTKISSQDLAIKVSVDPQIKRVTLQQTNSAELAFNASATRQTQCRKLDATVKFNEVDIFKPIELEMRYDLINGVPNSSKFCDICAAVDPVEPKLNSQSIIFSTGCKTMICFADLKVTSSGISSAYILGSSRTLAVTYEVSNSGETAFLPQINITSSNKMPFAKIPSSCNQNGHILLCKLHRGQPMAVGDKDKITIVYDVGRVEGKSMTLTAIVSSTGKEQTPENNILNDVIALKEFTEIEAVGKPQTPQINLEKVFNSTQIINNYEIKSNGPSQIQELEIVFEIPISIKSPSASPIIDIDSITIQGVYDRQILPVEIYQNETLLLVNPTEISKSSTKTIVVKNGNRVVYQSVSESVDLEKDLDKIASAGIGRSKRDVVKASFTDDYLKIAQRKPSHLLSEELVGTLPVNRTIVFSCIDPETTICAKAVLRVYNFLPDMPITVTIKYQVDLREVEKILTVPWEFFVIATKLDIFKIGDTIEKSIHITRKMEYNVISKHQLEGVNIWWIILAIVAGLVVLGVTTYVLYKMGFFKRAKKEEMDRLVQDQQQTAEAARLTAE